MKKQYRPWKTIAAELSQELDPLKVGALAEELDAAILAQSAPLQLQKNPYIRFRNCEWIYNVLSSSLLITNADFGTYSCSTLHAVSCESPPSAVFRRIS